MKNIFIILFLLSNYLISQGTAGLKPPFESQFCVNSSNAGVIAKNSIYSSLTVLDNNSLELIGFYGLFKDLNIGIGININNLTGEKSIEIPKIPGFMLKYRLIDENKFFPAVVIGFSSLGRVKVIDNRYFEPSPGFYTAFSKSFLHRFGSISFHSGINYSFETELKTLNYWIGIENSISDFASINLEFNPYLNDKSGNFALNQDILNLALRVSIGRGLTFDFKFLNLLDFNKINRNISLEYIRTL